MRLWRKTIPVLVALLCACLVVAGLTTFWKHDGSSDLTIKDAAPLPGAASGGVAAPPGVPSGSSTSATADGSLPAGLPSSPGKQATRTQGGARTDATTPSRRAPTSRTTGPGSSRTAKSVAPRPPSSGRVASAKKGAALWKTPNIASALTDSGVSWFYNWSNKPDGVSAPGVEFVPMMWGAASVTPGNLAAAKANGNVLLGFNEPDFASQSNISVDKALELWPQLQGTAMRLGSPAVAWGAADANGWLDRFMTGAKQKGYRVDFITLHWYGSDFRADAATGQLKSYVDAVWNKYHKPIWVTEYSLMSFNGGTHVPSAGVQADFVKKSTAMLRSLSYVERYAWFSFPTPTDGSSGTGLYRNGTATTQGRAYRAAG